MGAAKLGVERAHPDLRIESMDSRNKSTFLQISYTIPASLQFTQWICFKKRKFSENLPSWLKIEPRSLRSRVSYQCATPHIKLIVLYIFKYKHSYYLLHTFLLLITNVLILTYMIFLRKFNSLLLLNQFLLMLFTCINRSKNLRNKIKTHWIIHTQFGLVLWKVSSMKRK